MTSGHRSITARLLGLVVLIYVGTRLLNLLMFQWVATAQNVSVSALLMSWDGQQYLQLVQNGYPEWVEGAANGPWAWPPLYPSVAREISLLLGLGPELVLIILNVAFGLAGMLLLAVLLVPHVGRQRTAVVVALACLMPAAPVLIMGYAEGIFLAIAALSLLVMDRGYPWWALALVIPAGLTKLQALPLAITLVVTYVVVQRRQRRGLGSFLVLAAYALAAALAAAAWPIFVGLLSGHWDAYAGVQSSWGRTLVPFQNTVEWFGWIGSSPNRATVFSLFVLVAALMAAVYVVRQRSLPLVLRVLGVATPLFMLWLGAGVSTARLLLLDFALPAALGTGIQRRWILVLAALILLAIQVAWVTVFVAAESGALSP